MEQVYDDALWTTLRTIESERQDRYFGIAWAGVAGFYEGVNCIASARYQRPAYLQLLEQHPGRPCRTPRPRRKGHHVPDSGHALIRKCSKGK